MNASVWAGTKLVLAKEFRQGIRFKAAWAAMLMFALTTLSCVSLALQGAALSPKLAAALLWVILFFASMVGADRVFLEEEAAGTLLALRVYGGSQPVLLGKMLYTYLVLLAMGLFILPLFLMLLAENVAEPLLLFLTTALGLLGVELADHIVKVTDVREGNKPDVNLIYDALSDRPVVSWFHKPMFLSKAYELQSFFEGVAAYHRLTGDARTLAAAEAFWGHLFREELNPMRSASYFDHFLYAKHHVNGMTELCDVTHWIRLNRELWKLTGETKYLDCIEEAFYNAFLAGVTPDGAWGAHIIRSHGTRHLTAPAQTGMKLHQCCPDNMLRTFYDWADTVADVAKDGAWEVNLYSDADIVLPGARMELRGNYPVSETFRLRVAAEKGGKLRLRVPYWASDMTVDGKALKPAAGRIEMPVAAGERTFDLVLKMPPREIDSEAPDFEDIDTVTELDTMKPEGYTKRFMSWYTPEMKGLERRTAAAQIMRGPLVLAKGRAVGTSRTETLEFNTINKQPGWKLSLAPQKRSAKNAGVWGAWDLTLEKEVKGKGPETKTIPVADYWSVSCMDDPENWFSLWF